MRIFDRIDASSLDRREMQLWLLAIATITILATGMALLMYPTAFSDPVVLSGSTLRKVFLGFCGLSVLFIAYLLDRQYVMRQLRIRLRDEEVRNQKLRHQASEDLLETLPKYNHFQDRLPMELRRASRTQGTLSLLIIRINMSSQISGQNEIATAFGDAAKSIVRRLRREDSMYLFAPGVFGVLLPGSTVDAGYRVAERLEEGLHDASGASDRFTSEVRVVNYPDHTETASGMEQALRQFFTDHQLLPEWKVEQVNDGELEVKA